MPSPNANAGGAGRPAGAVVTHFAPPHAANQRLPHTPLVTGGLVPLVGGPGAAVGNAAAAGPNGAAGVAPEGPLAHTAKFFSLPMSLFESLLGQRFPLPSMQQVRWAAIRQGSCVDACVCGGGLCRQGKVEAKAFVLSLCGCWEQSARRILCKLNRGP